MVIIIVKKYILVKKKGKKKFRILHELLVFYLTKIVYCATLATIQNAQGVGKQNRRDREGQLNVCVQRSVRLALRLNFCSWSYWRLYSFVLTCKRKYTSNNYEGFGLQVTGMRAMKHLGSQQTINRWDNGSTLESKVGYTVGYGVRNC